MKSFPQSCLPLAVLVLASLEPVAVAQTFLSSLPWQIAPMVEPAPPAPGLLLCGVGMRPVPKPVLDLDQNARIEAEQFTRLRYPGIGTHLRISRVLNELVWHEDLESAQREARATGKPILWIQALGELGGYT